MPAETGCSNAWQDRRSESGLLRIRHLRIFKTAADIAAQSVGGLRMKMEEISALRKRLEEVEAQFLQQKVWRENADVNNHELLEENSKLQAKILETEKLAAEAADDFRYVMRHNKFLEGELRKLETLWHTLKRGRNETGSERPSGSTESESDGDIRFLSEVRAIAVSGIRTPIDRANIDASPPAKRSGSSGRHASRVILRKHR
ncbi:hypothetical protein R1sor_009234 [Riccia sorocarpa]|uniref:Uncharacterized protein n=1 Tax=Riccia sorocarpa TaxID=122646 RepID=A0ABD3H8R1_9MARC